MLMVTTRRAPHGLPDLPEKNISFCIGHNEARAPRASLHAEEDIKWIGMSQRGARPTGFLTLIETEAKSIVSQRGARPTGFLTNLLDGYC